MVRHYSLSIKSSEDDLGFVLSAEHEKTLHDSGKVMSKVFRGIQQISPCILFACVGDKLLLDISNNLDDKPVKLTLHAYTNASSKTGKIIAEQSLKYKQSFERERECSQEGIFAFQAAVGQRKDGRYLERILGIVVVLPASFSRATSQRLFIPSHDWMRGVTHENAQVIDWIKKHASRVLPDELVQVGSTVTLSRPVSASWLELPQLKQYGSKGLFGHMQGLLNRIVGYSDKNSDVASGLSSDNQYVSTKNALEIGADRHLVAQTQEKVEINEEFALAVKISTIPLPNVLGMGSTSIGDFVGKLRIDVIASGFTFLNDGIQTLEVPIAGDSAPLHFLLRAESEGKQTILIDAYNGAAHVAGLKLEIQVGVEKALEVSESKKSIITIRQPEEGEGMLSIGFDERDKRYNFRFYFENEEHPVVYSEPMLGAKQEMLASLTGMLNTEARNLKKRSSLQARYYMQGLGTTLYRELIPRSLKHALWDVRSKMKRLNIVSPTDTMPWEILYVSHPETEKEGKFLADITTVVRWFSGNSVAPAQLQRAPAYVVIPANAPKKAHQELAWVSNACGEAKLISDLDELLGLAHNGEFRWLHFAAHNESSTKMLETSYVPFGESSFDLLFMRGVPLNTYAPHQPLVFMNACTTASSKPMFTEMIGWADSFIKNGAAAFVGTFWEVRDESAAKFAQAFYLALKNGKDLGQAMRDGRDSLDKDDPTYLAYTLYGNPSALLQ